jgi:hypothetical protein
MPCSVESFPDIVEDSPSPSSSSTHSAVVHLEMNERHILIQICAYADRPSTVALIRFQVVEFK